MCSVQHLTVRQYGVNRTEKYTKNVTKTVGNSVAEEEEEEEFAKLTTPASLTDILFEIGKAGFPESPPS